jgi:sterol desaturase/sphingolipid hydroxylase (fatty acid hydroxylase superfamily)
MIRPQTKPLSTRSWVWVILGWTMALSAAIGMCYLMLSTVYSVAEHHKVDHTP